MAKNWTMAEAAKAVKNNDMVAIADLGKRFPLMMSLLTRGIAGDGDAVAELFKAIPEYLTANKVNAAIKNVVGDGEIEDDEEEAVEEPKKKADKPAKKTAKDVDNEDEEADDYDSMTGNELVALCKERGIWSKLKDKKKAGMIAGLRAADANDDVEEDDVEDEDGDEYSEMSPQELFKECKKRGLKPEMKKPAKYYIEMLKKDDAAADEDEDEDWEDEEEDEKPAKPAKKVDKKPVKKAAKKEVEEDEDEDEDWDI